MQNVSESFLQAVANASTMSSKATLNTLLGEAIDLPISTGDVNLAASDPTRATLSLSLAVGDVDRELFVPDDPYSPLAPYGAEIEAFRGFEYPDGTSEYAPLGVFKIARTDTTDDLSIVVTASDRSSIVIAAVMEQAGVIPEGTNCADQIQELVRYAIPDCVFDFVDTDITLPDLSYEAGDDRWDLCQGIAEAATCSLYFNGVGTCVLRTLAQASVADVVITEGEGGTLLGANKSWSNQDAVNRVTVSGENTASDPAYGEAIDDDPDSPTYYFGPFGKFSYPPYSSQFITSDEQAQSVAENILSLKRGTAQQIGFDALVNPALEPLDIAQVRHEGLKLDELHILDSLTIPLDHDGDMTAQTRVARVF